DQVSQDIPFSDGESGEIHWTLTAETPIFVRNGYAGEEKDPEFCHHEVDGVKQYFIPATSLKGMVRNVLEVMSLSRIRVRDDIFSFRSL
ncbi:MAG: RAMP superfamily CRISPR-associated protein, partial [Bacteroidota bacterium]